LRNFSNVAATAVMAVAPLAGRASDGVTATANDCRCSLAESGVQYAECLTGEYSCDVTQRTVPAPAFRNAATTGPSNGVAVAHCPTHPAYLRPTLRPTWVRSGRPVVSVVERQGDVTMACRECAAENYFGLCEELESP
jgi:hypothetical protein